MRQLLGLEAGGRRRVLLSMDAESWQALPEALPAGVRWHEAVPQLAVLAHEAVR